MSLTIPNLDDRPFQQIVDEAKRLIPELCPEWTNHNVADPGVALIELFAWMTEGTLYRINQIPERLYVKYLELMGVRLFPAVPAKTSLIFWLAGDTDAPVDVPRGTRIATVDSTDEAEVVFTTVDSVRVGRPQLKACVATTEAGATDRWEDLEYGEVPFPVFESLPKDSDHPGPSDTADGQLPDDALYLGFEASLGNHVVELDIQAKARGFGIEPDSPPRVWEASVEDGWARCAIYSDETGGLNRRGAVILSVPARHERATVNQQSAFWLRVRLTEPDKGKRRYATTPMLSRLTAKTIGAAVAAEHSEPFGPEDLGTSDGTPGQAFNVSQAPVLARRPGETVIVTSAKGSAAWREVDDFDNAGPGDAVFMWDSATGEIRFGPEIRYPDGTIQQHGAKPPDGAAVSVTRYRKGGGARANVGKGQLRRLLTTVPYVKGVENPNGATGGVDAETLVNVKRRGPQYLRSAERAITAGDYERIARAATQDVARSLCLPPRSAGQPIRLLIIPDVEHVRDASIHHFGVSADLEEQVARYVNERRSIGATIELSGPEFTGVSVQARIKPLPGRNKDALEEAVLEALYGFIDPLTGGPEGKGWPFGVDVTPAAVRTALSTLPGIDAIAELLLIPADLTTRERLGGATDIVRVGPAALAASFQHKVIVMELDS